MNDQLKKWARAFIFLLFMIPNITLNLLSYFCILQVYFENIYVLGWPFFFVRVIYYCQNFIIRASCINDPPLLKCPSFLSIHSFISQILLCLLNTRHSFQVISHWITPIIFLDYLLWAKYCRDTVPEFKNLNSFLFGHLKNKAASYNPNYVQSLLDQQIVL